MASPTVATSATSATSTAGTNHVVTLPASIAAGDLILICMSLGSTSATLNTHADYTELLDENAAVGLKILYRWAAGGESNPTFVSTASTRDATVALRITGALNPATQPPEIGTTSTASSAAPDPPAVTPTGGSKDYLFITFCGSAGEQADDGTYCTSFPTSYVVANLQKTCGVAGTNLGGMIALAGRQLTASTDNPGVFAVSENATWRAQTIAVHPTSVASVTGDADLTGLGSSTTVGVRTRLGATTLAGTGTETAVGVRTRLAVATLTGAGTSTTAGAQTAFAAAALTGTGSSTSAGAHSAFAAASLTGLGSSTTAGVRTRFAAAALAGAGSSATVGYASKTGAAALTGTGSLVASVGNAAFLTGTGTLTAAGVRTRYAVADLAGTGSSATVGVRTRYAVATLTGTGDLAASASASSVYATATLAGAGALAATGHGPATALTGSTTGTIAPSANGSLLDDLAGRINFAATGETHRGHAGYIAQDSEGIIA